MGLTVSPVAAAPTANQWVALPATGGASAFSAGSLVWGSKTGPDGRLYAFGAFTNAGGDPTADYLAVRDPATGTWSGLGANASGDGAFNGYVYDIAFQGGTVIAVGAFANAGGNPNVDAFAVWDGRSWTTRASATQAPFTVGSVAAVDVIGSDIYVGGSFLDVDAVPAADRIARWNGSTWSGLTAAGATASALNGTVYAIDALPDGRVFAGGAFTSAAGDTRAARIAWFDTSNRTWQGLREAGQVGPAIASGQVTDLAVIGSRVYAAGTFENVSGKAGADFVATWNGATWNPLGQSAANGTSGSGPLDAPATSLRAYGSTLIVAGSFTNAGANPSGDCVAAWNGTAWLNLGTPAPTASGTAMCTHGSVTGRTYTASGDFTAIAGVAGSGGLAQFGLPSGPSVPTTLVATAAVRSITLSWGLPVSTGGAAITDYVVQYRVAGTARWTTFQDGVRTTRTATITGLVTGTTYDVRVAARNGWAFGAFTAALRRVVL